MNDWLNIQLVKDNLRKVDQVWEETLTALEKETCWRGVDTPFKFTAKVEELQEFEGCVSDVLEVQVQHSLIAERRKAA